jgi:transcriptional regulator with XRE-family HTH domain
MPRSKALPDELDPHARQLVTRLRRLKDRDELTLRHLAAKTGYSAKSWERYLGGTSLPPREAVEALARITGTDPAPLLALREIAADSWDSRRTRTAEETRLREQDAVGEAGEPEEADAAEETRGGEPEPPGRPTAPRPVTPARFPHLVLTTVLAVLVVALGTALLLVLRHDDAAPAHVAPTPSSATASPPPAYTCHLTRVDGRWSAGINRGRDTEIGYGATGADVAEAQCLLRRAGISPGGIDGMFGPLTLRAVKTFQTRAGLVADGMVGPRSWQALRG